MDWFLYDNDLRHERVNLFHIYSFYWSVRDLQKNIFPVS